MKITQKKKIIIDTWQTTNQNILIDAKAGSGKTTLLLDIVELCDKRTLFLAFNKTIQEEIQQKLEERKLGQGKALTLHSLGLQCLRASQKPFEIKQNKNFDLVKILQKREERIFKSMRWEKKVKTTMTLIDMFDVCRMFLETDFDSVANISEDMGNFVHDHPRLPYLWEKFLEVAAESYAQQKILIDFLDMLYLPVKWKLDVPIDPYYLLMDEVQDFSFLQHKFIDLLLEKTNIERWAAVGDTKQSIYLFCGAFSKSFEMFRQKENVVQLDLTTCYRCPKKVIDSANEVFDIIDYGKEEEGIVEHIQNYLQIKPNSMVICRNSRPLIEVYFKLLAANKPAYIKGDDILSNLIKFLKPHSYKTIKETYRDLNKELQTLERDKTEQGRIKYYRFEEDCLIFKILKENFFCTEADTINTVLNKLKGIFLQKEEGVMLCTIHKAKGLENDVVYILNENLIPQKFAKTKEQLSQEENLRYVARTRAKKELYFLKM
jgi:superfamily I DNA/RNA helicase